jgi:asparagine synthetase A
MACPKMPDGCTVRAIYILHLGIYLDDTLDMARDPFARSILLHELVHHAQAVMARFPDLSTCEARKASEEEAYEVQSSYLHKVGSPKQLPRGTTQMLRCPTEVKTEAPANASYKGAHGNQLYKQQGG